MVIALTPETAQFYQEFPLFDRRDAAARRDLPLRRRDSRPQGRRALSLALRIDRETTSEDVQLTVWSNESMLSDAFAGFYLSDLEYGVRSHHDHLRELLPVLDLEAAPEEKEMWQAQRGAAVQKLSAAPKVNRAFGKTEPLR